MSEAAGSAPPSSATPSQSTQPQNNSPTFQSSTVTSPDQSNQAHSTSTASNPSQLNNKTPANAPELYEVKINGRTVKMTKDELVSHASMAQAAQEKFAEAARTRKEVDRIINTAKSNPIQALMDPSLGLSKEQIRDAFESWYKKEFIDPTTLNPDQLKARDLEERLKSYEQKEREAKEQAEREQMEQLTAKQRDYLQKQIIDAIDKSGLPKTKFFAQRMAFYMRENLRNGWEAPLDLIVSQVKQERQSMMSDLTENADVPTLINLLGDNLINKIRKYDLEQLRARRGMTMSTPQVDSQGNTGKVDYNEVNRRLNEMRRKGW